MIFYQLKNWEMSLGSLNSEDLLKFSHPQNSCNRAYIHNMFQEDFWFRKASKGPLPIGLKKDLFPQKINEIYPIQRNL